MSIPAPDTRELLLPLLACLPSAYLGPRPPAPFLPLLSPILRQRVHLFTTNTRSNQEHLAPSQRTEASNWLNLLTWSPERASRLIEIVGGLQLEAHPVSGELELSIGKTVYRRLDAETLQAMCDDEEHEISVVWVWCENDTGTVSLTEAAAAQPENGWRVTEVRPADTYEEETWYDSIEEAEQAVAQSQRSQSRHLQAPETINGGNGSPAPVDDDDDYWAAYDQTPATRTPAVKPSPLPPQNGVGSDRQRQHSAAEADYFARYAEEVQPAMDGHDPDEEDDAAGVESSFNHHSREVELTPSHNGHSLHQNEDPPITVPATHARIHSPSPTRPGSAASVEHLEESASSASFAVQGHISTQMKSMYRLARATGIDKEEYRRLIQRELEVLDMIDI
jgi:hypothetical protein